ncbi:MAG: GxxExxY protein [Xanthomonadaceae bacterium]|nr:GxxExxY protein [Xanthomonadaceae bacterium]
MIREDRVSRMVIGAAIEVHRALGPGLLESAYEECLCHELLVRRVRFERQCNLPVKYKGVRLECGYRMDLVVDGCLLLELKAVDSITMIHEAQLLTYLKLTKLRLGLLINFNVPVLHKGIRRFANGF